MDQRLDFEYLNSCRMASGLTNKAISSATNISEPTISRFFHGEMKDPSAYTLCAICDTIGASIDRAYGVVKPIDQALSEPAPSIPAVVTDVVQAISDIVDERTVAEHVAEVIKESPVVDPRAIADAVIAALPPHDCDSCRTARLYEASILRQSKLISVLLAALGSLGLLMVALVIWLLQ